MQIGKSKKALKLKFKQKDVIVNPEKIDAEAINVFTSIIEQKEGEIHPTYVVNSAGEFESKDIFVTSRKLKGSDKLAHLVNGDGVAIGLISNLESYEKLDLDIFRDLDILVVDITEGTDERLLRELRNCAETLVPKYLVLHIQEGKEEELKKHFPKLEEHVESNKIERSALEGIEDYHAFFIK